MPSSSLQPSSIHPVSASAFTKGLSEQYNKYRPSYDTAVLSHIRKAVSARDGLHIVDIGCGTGIFTRDLLAHPEWRAAIAEIECVEPDEGMRAVFAKTVDDPRAHLSEGTFEHTKIADGWADMVVSATAFHWCLDLEAAMNEFMRILKPGGTLCFLWNLENGKKALWMQQLLDLYEPYQEIGAASRWMERNNWRKIYDLPIYKQNFNPPKESTVFSTTPGTIESVTLRVLTWSAVATLQGERKQKLREDIERILRRGDGLVWSDEGKTTFEIPMETPVVIIQKKRRATVL